jgi:hypothetical protein
VKNPTQAAVTDGGTGTILAARRVVDGGLVVTAEDDDVLVDDDFNMPAPPWSLR